MPRAWPCVLLLSVLATRLPAQENRRDAYGSQLPPVPSPVRQTNANAYFRLYGRPGDLRSFELRHGTDRARADRLLALAEQFSPVMRRNVDRMHPVDFMASIDPPPILHVDTWRNDTRLPAADISLAEFGAPGPLGRGAAGDDQLRQVLRGYLGRGRATAPEQGARQVYYFDFMGDDPGDWRKRYRRDPEKKQLYAPPYVDEGRIYVHPFVAVDTAAANQKLADSLDFVLQYWFFYPYNDGPNDHEGDWEHINVVLAKSTKTAVCWQDTLRPRRRVKDGPAEVDCPERRLNVGDVASILRDPIGPVLQDLVIGHVDYHFHHYFLRVDYLGARRDGDRAIPPGEALKQTRKERARALIEGIVRTRLDNPTWGQAFATHPIVYIGGNSKGPDELLQLIPGSGANQSTGASYPTPGSWNSIGPLNASESIHGGLVPKPKKAPTIPVGSWASVRANLDDKWVAFGRDQIRILPDWERLEPFMVPDGGTSRAFRRASRAIRREWAWMFLPVRFGFPAADFFLGGIVPNADLGNVAPLGPAFNGGWNRLGESPGSVEYVPISAHPLQPLPTWAMFANNRGVLNHLSGALLLVPGGAVVFPGLFTIGSRLSRNEPVEAVYYPADFQTPSLVLGTSMWSRTATQRRSEFARLFTRRERTLAGRQVELTDLQADGMRLADQRARDVGIAVRYGDRWSLESHWTRVEPATITAVQSVIVRDADPTGPQPRRDLFGDARAEGTFHYAHVTAGLRFDAIALGGDKLRGYGRFGYGLSRYSLEPHSLALLDGAGRDTADHPQFFTESDRVIGGWRPSFSWKRPWESFGDMGPDSVWPDAWYFGAGGDVLSPPAPPGLWLFSGTRLGARGDVTWHFTQVRVKNVANVPAGVARQRVTSFSVFVTR